MKISPVTEFFDTAWHFVLDILFPVHCLGCKKEGHWFCKKCSSGISISREHFCPVCERVITPDGRTCLNCKKKNALAGLIIASTYTQFPIANAIHLFKYRFVADLHVPLGELLVNVLQHTEIPLPEIIIPVPLHKRRLRWRGFNQSALLAKYVASHLLSQNILTFSEDILLRRRHTPPQMEVRSHAARKLNIANAFTIFADASVANKTILLVDDVATTGSTLFECAKVLKKAGAKEVFAIVVARQETKR